MYDCFNRKNRERQAGRGRNEPGRVLRRRTEGDRIALELIACCKGSASVDHASHSDTEPSALTLCTGPVRSNEPDRVRIAVSPAVCHNYRGLRNRSVAFRK
jgi:hypothetical protein